MEIENGDETTAEFRLGRGISRRNDPSVPIPGTSNAKSGAFGFRLFFKPKAPAEKRFSIFRSLSGGQWDGPGSFAPQLPLFLILHPQRGNVIFSLNMEFFASPPELICRGDRLFWIDLVRLSRDL